MGMNQTPMSERVHIGFFGKRNAGKSSVTETMPQKLRWPDASVKYTGSRPAMPKFRYFRESAIFCRL